MKTKIQVKTGLRGGGSAGTNHNQGGLTVKTSVRAGKKADR